MEISQHIPRNALDDNAAGTVGKSISRVDGRLKVTGQATYAAEYHEIRAAYGFIVGSAIGKGSIVSIDTAAVSKMPGVLLVLTHENVARQGKGKRTKAQLVGRDIHHYGQPVALVVARGFEQARDAAAALTVKYADDSKATGRFDRESIVDTASKPKASDPSQPVDTAVGKFDPAFDKAEVKTDVTYTTPDQSHAAMEPHATIAEWKDGALTVHTSNQMPNWAVEGLSGVLKTGKDKVRVITPYIGGGFGGKLDVCNEAVLAALAARKLDMPVKVVQTRQQVFFNTSRRSETVQRLRLGAHRDGTLVAIGHNTWSDNLPDESTYEPAGLGTRMLYAAPNRETTHRLAAMDKVAAASMRAPGEAVGMLALENAMDELAERLGMDPVALRIKNEPSQDPEKKVPFSSRSLVACLEDGARRFGWSRRSAQPRRQQEGRWWIGMGVAAAVRANPLVKSKARVQLQESGNVLVQTAMTDIGTGTYTILSQIAADLLGVPLDKVEVELGDTLYPAGAGSGGSWGAGSSGSSVYDACMKIRAQLAQRAGTVPDKATIANGALTDGAQTVSVADLAKRGAVEALGEVAPGQNEKTHTQAGYGAHFVEVGVNMDTYEVRVRRMLGVFAAGRILNEKTARSQCIGGMIFGVGAALHEELVTDKRYGSFINHDLAEYHVPVHADIPDIEVVFLPELDEWSNPLKSKGIGELGISGAGAAVTNAIYNACGIRVRDYPVTLDKLLEQAA
ncbi:xanthine dehydrogenase family protein molybdopterin-binding subunit [Xylophilus ampelinus]|uniref:Xanthine dehydrogenase YagR molybdenum-binding subunit n=1 Tax=Xylophilus ampelinus TaxID=54067 RepID=A0A318SQD2_9BURK|nr:xanthine dehydrogenase family protein molybdopterin-binding subunit [Xylophilus ampelinus]MCS4509192.1 xanthine dehydrogenase family protein molybdopterin-binding subunit [Xylophilus ampelinus]PYE79782.1 xanthine dehydrogenase YagR molybdenum-binding subunit [Xylophilus ampelinus]